MGRILCGPTDRPTRRHVAHAHEKNPRRRPTPRKNRHHRRRFFTFGLRLHKRSTVMDRLYPDEWQSQTQQTLSQSTRQDLRPACPVPRLSNASNTYAPVRLNVPLFLRTLPHTPNSEGWAKEQELDAEAMSHLLFLTSWTSKLQHCRSPSKPSPTTTLHHHKKITPPNHARVPPNASPANKPPKKAPHTPPPANAQKDRSPNAQKSRSQAHKKNRSQTHKKTARKHTKKTARKRTKKIARSVSSDASGC